MELIYYFNSEHSPVLLETTKGSTVSLCGGSIIDEKNILTAAHCTDGKDSITVWVKDHNRLLPDGESKEFVCGWTQHPEFERIQDYPNKDISILHLCEPLTFTDGKLYVFYNFNTD